MTLRTTTLSTALVLAAGLGLGLSGCAPTATRADPSAQPVSPASPTSAATESPEPTATAPAESTPTAEPSAAAPAPSCETALSADEYASLAADGLTFLGEAPRAAAYIQPGGISCRWGRPNSDILESFAQWPSDGATWDALTSQLVTEGALVIDDSTVEIPDSDSAAALTYRDGTVYYGSPIRVLETVVALQ